MNDDHGIEAELVWRLGSGNNIEITEFGVFSESNRRKGIGTRLLRASIDDMLEFSKAEGIALLNVYLFCETRNAAARSFYESHGFKLQAQIGDMYEEEGGAVLYSINIATADQLLQGTQANARP
jgi:ribosomal protein S18 acetylase RimI-like enzyme